MEKLEFGDSKVDRVIESSDIAIDPESGLAVVVIKPDAFLRRDLIIKQIEGAGLYVAKAVTKRLPDDFVIGEMYKGLPKGLEEETLKHFNVGPSEILLVEGGEDLLQKVVSLTGEKTSPRECSSDSIRYIFGEHFSRPTEDGQEYYRNAAHRAKDRTEQAEDLKKFRHFL